MRRKFLNLDSSDLHFNKLYVVCKLLDQFFVFHMCLVMKSNSVSLPIICLFANLCLSYFAISEKVIHMFYRNYNFAHAVSILI